MGLDSYLMKRIYIGGNNVTGEISLKRFNDAIDVNIGKLNSIFELAVYWRKSWYIHEWMVENVQNDEDNGAIYYVSSYNLNKLLETCQKDLDYLKSLKDMKDIDESNINLKNEVYDEHHIYSLEYSVEKLSDIVLNDNENDYSYSYYYEGNW